MSGLSLLPLAACGESDETNLAVEQPGGVEGERPTPRPVYAMSTLVWSDAGATGYVFLSDTLDLGDVSLARARELSGYTSITPSSR